jgi:ubiquinone/menaquinone biosynthesis C-methylase UbiE
MDDRERTLQNKLATRLLDAGTAERDAAYREVYEAFHTYLRSDSGRRSFLYRKQALGQASPSRRFKAWVRRLAPSWARATSEEGLVGAGHGEVLELGCGEGWLSLALATSNRHVVGVDISDQCIELCRRNQQEHGVSNVEFHRQSGVRLTFKDDTFDRAVSTEFLEHLHPDDVPVHLAEVRRVLKPGGRYVVVTPNRHRHHDEDDGTLHLRLYSFAELADLFSAAGFSPVLSPYFKTNLLVNVRHKTRLEDVFHRSGLRHGWGGTGLSSVVVCGVKPGEEHQR